MKYKKILKTIYIGALITLLFASCSQDGDGIPDGVTHAPLMVSTVSMATGGTKANTRTTLPTPIESGKLWVGIRGNNGYEPRKGLSYTYNNNNHKWESSQSHELGEKPISLYAYWPQNGEYVEKGGTVELTSQSYDPNKDLGYAVSGGENVCSSHPSAGFILNHAYARISTEISFPNSFADKIQLNEVLLIAEGLSQKGRLVIESGTLIQGITSPEIKWPVSKTMIDINRKFTSDYLIVPSESMTNTKLTVTVDKVNYNSDLSADLNKLEAGKRYIIKAYVSSSHELIINSVKIEDWKQGESQNGETQFE